MNSTHGYSEGSELYIQKPIVMDLTKRREELLAEKAKQETIKDLAHRKILEINGKLRKLAFVVRDAEELFPVENVEHEPSNKGKSDNHA